MWNPLHQAIGEIELRPVHLADVDGWDDDGGRLDAELEEVYAEFVGLEARLRALQTMLGLTGDHSGPVPSPEPSRVAP